MYLLDTSIVSELLKKRPSTKILDWLDAQSESSLFLSSLTIAELQKGLFKLEKRARARPDRQRVERIRNWIQEVEARFEGRVLPVDRDVLTTWAQASGAREADGTKLPIIDSLLAATALALKLKLVTVNEGDFRRFSSEVQVVHLLGGGPS